MTEPTVDDTIPKSPADDVIDNDNNDDSESIGSDGSEFLGSLGIYAPQGTWESDLRVNLDLQLGRDEWMTSCSAIDGGKKLLTSTPKNIYILFSIT